MKLAGIITTLSAICLLSWTGNNNYPTDYFNSPVDRAIQLSGTFGELRGNHFHAGLDIKSIDGQPGEKIFSAAEGYIARIKVEPGGYGNALYIAHPNGYTTVYAHLDRFIDTIAQYVKERQYASERFSQDIDLPADKFRIDKHQLIGYLGNSGSSFGPHLHFEIRRTSGQVPINPLHFGIEIEDNISPRIRALGIHYLDNEYNPYQSRYYDLIALGNGKYIIRDTLEVGAWRVGFALKTDDRMDGTPNNNGIYSLAMYVDSVEYYLFNMDEVPFNKTRYLNAHIDYEASARKRGHYHRCYRLRGNTLDIYSNGSKGPAPLYAEIAQEVVLVAKDYHGNSSELKFYIRRDTSIVEPDRTGCMYTGNWDRPVVIQTPEFEMEVGKNMLYSEACINLDATSVQGKSAFTVGDPGIPLHSYSRISLKKPGMKTEIADKYFIARYDNGKISNYGGAHDGVWIRSFTRDFGTYFVEVDTVPPQIKPIEINSDMRGRSRIRIRITDNYPAGGKAQDLTYQATLDGKWMLFEYDAKNDMLIHNLDGRFGPGDHELILKVTDDRGNTATYHRQILL